MFKNQYGIDHFNDLVNLRYDAYLKNDYSWHHIDEVLEICLKPYLTLKEIIRLSRVDDDTYDDIFDVVEDVFYGLMYDHAEDWDDRDPRYPNNTYYEGFKLGGTVFVTNYSGIAGRHWNYDSYYDYATFICRPW